MADAKIDIENLCKAFSTQEGAELSVLKGLNLKIDKNELIMVTGPSGCGKTTLLNIIAGLTTPTSGRILLNGQELSGPSRKIGVVFQQDAVFMWRKVLQNAEFGLEMQGIPKAERRKIALKYLEMTGLKDFINFFPKELSGGMKKRLQLATVWANNPEVLLMDEPFGSLDYPTKIILQKEVEKMWLEDPKVILFVTHDIEEAIFLADRILVLVDGILKEDLRIQFSRPRKNILRASPDFQSIKQSLWEYLG